MSRSYRKPIIKDKPVNKNYNRSIKRNQRREVNIIKSLIDPEDYDITDHKIIVNDYDVCDYRLDYDNSDLKNKFPEEYIKSKRK